MTKEMTVSFPIYVGISILPTWAKSLMITPLFLLVQVCKQILALVSCACARVYTTKDIYQHTSTATHKSLIDKTLSHVGKFEMPTYLLKCLHAMPYKPKTHRRRLPGRRDDSSLRRLASTQAQLRAVQLRNTSRWQRLRARVYSSRPICFDPFGEHGSRVVPTEHVHHIIGLAIDPSLAFDESNLAPLCSACHHRIEQMERAGHPTQKFFEVARPSRSRGPEQGVRGPKSLESTRPTPSG